MRYNGGTNTRGNHSRGGFVPRERGLIERAKRGDRAAVSELYRRHVDAIYRYIHLRVGDPVLAEDLTAEVFLKMLEGIKGCRYTGAPFVAWLYRIAHARTVDHWRRSDRKPEAGLSTALATTEFNLEAVVNLPQAPALPSHGYGIGQRSSPQ
jgi:RNA polymerase sigma-70 factor (ECF subfamily)